MVFDIGDRIIGVGSVYKGLEYEVVDKYDDTVKVLPIKPISTTDKNFHMIYEVLISEVFFEIDTKYYRNIKLNKLLL